MEKATNLGVCGWIRNHHIEVGICNRSFENMIADGLEIITLKSEFATERKHDCVSIHSLYIIFKGSWLL